MIQKIYIDMDGVLADFDAWKDEFAKIHPEILQSESAFWVEAAKVERLYWNLKPLPDAFLLMDCLESFNTPLAILTAIPRRTTLPSAEQDKREWVRTYFGNIEFSIGPYSKNKQRFSGPGRLLIDDRESNIEEWIARGGVGILHKSAKQTVKLLEGLI